MPTLRPAEARERVRLPDLWSEAVKLLPQNASFYGRGSVHADCRSCGHWFAIEGLLPRCPQCLCPAYDPPAQDKPRRRRRDGRDSRGLHPSAGRLLGLTDKDIR